jgi:hypothetical protein
MGSRENRHVGSRLNPALGKPGAPLTVNKLFRAGHAVMVNSCMVNRSAVELFPSSFILKKSFIHFKIEERRALQRMRITIAKPLKTRIFLSLTKCPLNRI